ncbi:restriction endonuclease subunit S [Paraburkholderia graminis]|uniref:restriction endonuclease subunit S n=1 Tax=Paraburkholderia graminis TaxID=60548 RepID=UPI0038B97368
MKLTEGFNLLATAPDGIKRLRELILSLAVQGKLAPQDTSDEPASELLRQIRVEKDRLIAEGKIKKGKPLPVISDDEKPFEVPEGWEWVRLGDSSMLITDGTHRTPKYISSGVAFISVKDINGRTVSFDDCKYISDEEHREINSRCNPERNDLLICRIGTLGRVTVVDSERPFSLFVSVGLIKMPKRVLISRYMHLLLSSPVLTMQYQEIKAGGSHTSKLNLGDIPNLKIPLPPLAEQSRIVAKVEELMALCDALETRGKLEAEQHGRLTVTLFDALAASESTHQLQENWARLASNFDLILDRAEAVDALEQTILQLAVHGLLVEQDPSDEPAGELLKQIRAEKDRLIAEGKIKKDKPLPPISDEEKPFELPQGWEWVKFEHIAANEKNALKAGPFGSALKKDMYCETGYKIYGQEQVISGDENIGDYFIDESTYQKLNSCAVKSGDFLISLVGTIGRVLVLSDFCAPGIINPRLVKISLFMTINRDYIQVVFKSPLLRNEMVERSHGGTMDILNLGLLKDFMLPLPPLAEQARIVARVDALRARCADLRRRLTTSQKIQTHLAEALVEKAA